MPSVRKLSRRRLISRKNSLPSQAKEGDVLIIKEDTIEIDAFEPAKRKQEIETLIRGLWK